MKRFLSLLPAVLVFLLAGCGQGTSISSLFSSESSSKSSEDESIKKSKTISADSSAKSVSTVAAATYIFGAITKEYVVPKGFEAELISTFRQGGKRNPEASLTALQKRFSLSDDALTAALCVFATRPRIGWPFDPYTITSKVDSFLSVSRASVIVTNHVGTLIAEKLATSVYRDPVEADRAVLETFRSIDHQAIRAEWIENVNGLQLVGQDMAGDGSIHFLTKDRLDISADQNGFKYAKAGHPVFGQDLLSSKKVELSFETSSATRMQRSKDLTSTESTDQTNSRKSTVEVK